jgi:hypothetical protein
MGTACSDRREHAAQARPCSRGAELLGWDGYFVSEDHFDGWTLASRPDLFLASQPQVDAIDPNLIDQPGRCGIWPAAYRDR